jgi:CDGSH-type Zn-finger protein
MADERGKIKIRANGPYLVSGGLKLAKEIIVADKNGDSKSYRKGQVYDCPQEYALCRCSASKNKPFCDGCHIDEKFDDGDKSLDKKMRKFIAP